MKSQIIAVFDSRESDLAVTAAAVREYYSRLEEDAEITPFGDARAFVLYCRDNRLDMAFIGINNMRDLETARCAARLNLQCPLYFVSEADAINIYGHEGQRLNILHYLDKPVTFKQVHEAVSRIGSFFAVDRRRYRPNDATSKIYSPY